MRLFSIAVFVMAGCVCSNITGAATDGATGWPDPIPMGLLLMGRRSITFGANYRGLAGGASPGSYMT
jgi:hypothetical protein